MQMPECNGHVCLYTCMRDFADLIGSKDEQSMIVPYDYQIHVPTTLSLHIELEDALREVESLMLQYIAQRFGLDGCDLNVASDQFGMDDYWTYDDNTTNQLDAIIGSIASAPADTVDESKDLCDFSSIDGAPDNTTCFPINGFMRVKYAGEVELAGHISRAIVNSIRFGLNDGVFKTYRIQQIDYSVTSNENLTGWHEVDQVGGVRKQASPAISGAGIGIIVTACTAVIVGAALLLRKALQGKKKHKYMRTPSPNAGKKSGLRAYDSECVRADFDDVCFNLESSYREQLDPYELDPEAPSILLESNLNNVDKNTALSRISEASKETGSTKSGARAFIAQGIGSPSSSTMQSFTRILSESTYSDGIHNLDRSVLHEDEFDNFVDDYGESKTQSFTPSGSTES